MIATDLARVNTEVKHRAEKERQTSRDIKKDVFSSYHERGTKKKFWVPMRNRTLDLRSYALMLYHWATETLRWKPQQPRSRYAWFVCLASFATLQMNQFSIAAMDWVSIDESRKSTLMVVYIKNTWFWYLFRRSFPLSIHGIPALEQGWMAFLLLTLSKSHILAFNVLPRVTSWAVMNTMRDVSRFTNLLTFGRWQDTALTLTPVWDQ